jgi:hypothetical protein
VSEGCAFTADFAFGHRSYLQSARFARQWAAGNVAALSVVSYSRSLARTGGSGTDQ